MKRPNAWDALSEEDLIELERFSADYIEFLSHHKTERECCSFSIDEAKKAGYLNLADCVAQGRTLRPGDKVYSHCSGKTLILFHMGSASLEDGLNILGAHIDSPRLDVKQNPLDEDHEIARLDTHYYGGIKKYHWVTMALALHGVVILKDGSTVTITIGEDPADPVFYISDLLIHLGREQMTKNAATVIEGEMLDVIVGNRPLIVKQDDAAGTQGGADVSDDAGEHDAQTDRVVKNILAYLKDKFGIEEEDFLSAEIEVVPAGPAREVGFDRSMIMGYGHDDRICAYPSLIAQLECVEPVRSALTLLADKEEIGSVGSTGMTSRFFENTVAEILNLAGYGSSLSLRRCLANSRMLSSDVAAGFDPTFSSVFEQKNTCYLGHGLTFHKFTGSGGKGGSNDANAEYVALIRRIMDEAHVCFQTAELGKVDVGGGGTIAYILAEYGMQVIDSGVPVLSMHAPWELASKVDLYEAYRGYKAFLAAS